MLFDPGPTPLYFQLKNILKSKIISNELKGQERLPSESELCIEYKLSRATVRQALSELVKEGFIYRERGRGSFVTDRTGLKHLALKGTIENLIAAGRGTKLKVLAYEEFPPPPHVAKIFKLKKFQNVFMVEAVRFATKGPFGYSFAYIPPDLGEKISLEELSETIEIIEFIEEKSNKRAHRATQTIDVAIADEAVARNLSIPPKSPVLVIEREYYSRDGSPLFVSLTYFRPDMYKYKIELTRA